MRRSGFPAMFGYEQYIRHHAQFEWIEWAATEKVSETVAAPVLLICEGRPVHEVVAKLTPGEFERVVDIVRRSPDHFPSGTQPRSRAVVRCPHAGRDRIAS